MRALMPAAAAAAMLALAGCSSNDLAVFAVGMQEAGGTYWPDQSQSNTLECASGYGYVVEYSGVSGGQGYIYYTSYADDGVSIDLDYDDGDSYTLYLGYGETSGTYYNHPGFAWNSGWVC